MILENTDRMVYGDSDDALGPSLLTRLGSIGWARFPETKVHGLTAHQHPAFELCFIVDGAVTWWIEDQRFDVSRGEVFYTCPEELHGGVDMMMHPCELFWLQVYPGEETDALFGVLRAEGPRHFPVSDAGTLFSQLHTEHRHPEDFAELAAQALLYQLLVAIVRARSASQHRVLSPAISSAITWMSARLGEPFAVQQVADVVGMHPSRFHERFLSEVGQTPAEWRVRQRITQAKELLSDSNCSITEIALSLGFATSQSFATAFKRYTGRTPTEYRIVAVLPSKIR